MENLLFKTLSMCSQASFVLPLPGVFEEREKKNKTSWGREEREYEKFYHNPELYLHFSERKKKKTEESWLGKEEKPQP